MEPPFRWQRPLATLVNLLALHAGLANGILVSICSSENTGSDMTPSNYHLNSLGYCSDNICAGSAFAITQQDYCWCSDIAPGTSVNTGSCNFPCPGFPYEFCGSTSGLFSYVRIGTPSGTAGSSRRPTSSAPTSSPTGMNTIVRTVINTIISNNVVYRTTEVVRTSVVAPGGNSPQGTNSATNSPADSNSGVSTSSSGGLSGGAIAGIVVGALAAVAILTALILWCFWRRRGSEDAPNGESRIMNRGNSVLSKAGLLRRSSSRRGPSSGSATAYGGVVGSRAPRLDTDIPEMSEGPSSATSANLERRDSRPLFVDQRLNPNALMVHSDASRTSVATLQDNADYSRPLEVRNP